MDEPADERSKGKDLVSVPNAGVYAGSQHRVPSRAVRLEVVRVNLERVLSWSQGLVRRLYELDLGHDARRSLKPTGPSEPPRSAELVRVVFEHAQVLLVVVARRRR